jgi:hypothetical protein
VPGACVLAINWNGAGFLGDMVESLLPQLSETGCRLVVFDNASEDGSDEMVLQRFVPTGLVELVRWEENLGFAGAANLMMERLREDIVVLANTDTVFRPGSLAALLAAMEDHPEAGLAGPRLLWPDGSLQPSMRDFPFAGRLVVEHLPLLRRLSARHRPHVRGRCADWLVGAVMAIRMTAFRQAGGFDTDFFFYHEETDLQYRLWKKGWRVWFEPSSEVVHIEGASARRKYGRMTYLRYIPAKLRFLRKHSGAAGIAAFRATMTALQLGRLLAGAVRAGSGGDLRYTPEYCRRALRLLWERSGGGRSR